MAPRKGSVEIEGTRPEETDQQSKTLGQIIGGLGVSKPLDVCVEKL